MTGGGFASLMLASAWLIAMFTDPVSDWMLVPLAFTLPWIITELSR